MKKTLSISMVFLVLLFMHQQVVILVCFKLNQPFIEEAYCINKASPELQCHGQCYLQEQLEQSEENGGNEFSFQINVTPVLLHFTESAVHFFQRRREKYIPVSEYKESFYPVPYLEILIPPPKAV